MKRFIIVLCALLFCNAVFAKAVTVNNRFEFNDAIVNPSVNSIIIKTSNVKNWVNFDYALDRDLSIAGSRNPLSLDDTMSSTLYMLMRRGINLTSTNLSLKNIAVANYDGDDVFFDDTPLFIVGEGNKLTLDTVCIQSNAGFAHPLINNDGIVDISSAYLFNEGNSFDIKNSGVVNFNKGTSFLDKGIYSENGGTVNVKGGQVKFSSHALLHQENLNITKGGVEINPVNMQVPNVLNNVKNGLVFSYNEMENDYSTKESLGKVTLYNTNISGKGSVRIDCNMVLDSTSTISQTINIPTLTKTTLETVESIDWEGNPVTFETEIINAASSLTANADNIKGVVNNNAALNLTGGTITKAINGKGITYILGVVTNDSKINQTIAIDTGSLTTNAGSLKKGIEIFNSDELHLTGGNFKVGLMGRGTLFIDGVVGNQTILDEGSLFVSKDGLLVTNASLLRYYFPGFEGDGHRTISNEGIIQLSSGTLSNVNVISNNGEATGYDVTKGIVQVTGKVKISPIAEHTPKIYQFTDITKKGNLTTSADALKGNVVNEGTLNLNGGTLEIANTEDRQFAVQNSKTMNVTDVTVKSDIDNWGKLTVKDSIIGSVHEGKVTTTDGVLIENYKTMTMTSSKNGKNVVSNLKDSLAILNKGKATLTVNGSATFKDNYSAFGGVIRNVATKEGTPTINLNGKSSGYYYLWGSNYNDNYSFEGNSANNGGAIFNSGGIVNVKNYYFRKNRAMNGGVLYNGDNGKITVKNSHFYENSTGESGSGGVVFNNGGKYVDNGSTYTSNRSGWGGAIYNHSGTVQLKNTVFKDNGSNIPKTIYDGAGGSTTEPQFTTNNGGAIYNDGDLVVTNSTFGGSTTKFYYYIMSDDGETILDIEEVDGVPNNVYPPMPNRRPTFEVINLGNRAKNGGAIYNRKNATISGSNFEYNQAEVGGAIYNTGKLTVNKNSVFTNNTAENKGGAIYTKTMDDTPVNIQKSKFYNNSSKQDGGAIYVESGNVTINGCTIGSVDYAGNTAQNGGGIYNAGNDTKIISTTFAKNSADKGGDIYNTGVLNISKSTFGYVPKPKKGQWIILRAYYPMRDFYNNYPLEELKNIAFKDQNVWRPIEWIFRPADKDTYSDFVGSVAEEGGAIYNTGTVNITSSKFNSSGAVKGGAIYNAESGIATIKNSTFTNNGAMDRIKTTYSDYDKETQKWKETTEEVWVGDNLGGAIYNAGKMDISGSTFKKNFAEKGGAIYNTGEMNIVGSAFSSNKADKGGAIYLAKDSEMYIQDTSFTNNIAEVAGGAIYMDENSVLSIAAVKKNVVFSGNTANGESNSIYMADGSVLNLGANKGRTISIKDKISADGNVTINKWGKGKIYIVDEKNMNNVNFTIKDGGEIDIANGKVGTIFLKSLNLIDDTNARINIDVKKATSDKIQAETVTGDGKLNVSSVNLVSNSKTPVTINVGENSVVSSISAKTAESAEATYKLKSYYDENGLLRVVAYGQRAKPSAVAAPVAAQIGGYLTQINSYDQAFMNMDMNMLVPRSEREAMQQTYSCENKDGIEYNGKGLWNRPYATFERVNLNNGPKVNNIGYGNYFGGDADMKQLNNGWRRQFSAYVGYNGSVQDYDRQSIDQNGGTVGVTEVWYKNNFFTGLTLNAGANVAQASTDLGRENMPMFMTGIASKTGYNFEFKECKFIVQPSLLLSYSFIHTFAHDNGLGHRVSSSPLNAIQVAPGIKFIANLKNGWQPYFNVNMRWNIIDKTHFALQDVTIPDMSIDPYVEYGLGLQRRWGERFTGFGQAMIRNGGRNGVMLSFGFKWLIGR